MNLTEIQELIKFVSKSGVTEVEIERKDFKITIKSDSKKKTEPVAQQIFQAPIPMPQALPPQAFAAPAPSAPSTPQVAPEAVATPGAGADNAKLITIKSPMIGTFYRSPSPDKAAFVNVGDDIKPGVVLCVIEAMKLFNEIECEVSGKVVKVLVDDASPVEYDQPLFLVEPA